MLEGSPGDRSGRGQIVGVLLLPTKRTQQFGLRYQGVELLYSQAHESRFYSGINLQLKLKCRSLARTSMIYVHRVKE